MRHRRFISDDGYSTDPCDTFSSESSDSDNSYDQSVDNFVPDFGILFDVDGVLARGSEPLTPAIEAIKYLKNSNNQMRIPVAFVTNACSPRKDKAAILSQWLGVQVDLNTVILAPSPCAVLTQYHDKHVLVVGQEKRCEIAQDLGFTNLCVIDDIKDAYPLLDIVNHCNRRAIAKGYTEKTFPKVEAILLLGEPTEWESHLQLLIDLMVTDGLPTTPPTNIRNVRQLPIIACNMDLQFMAQACMPRFGHGAFLVCLEALYKKITGHDLSYSVLVGKPVELTYRYAEHIINNEAKRMGINRPIKKLYFIGDNHQVDIVGANLYHQYVRRASVNRLNGNPATDASHENVPNSRRISYESQLSQQTVEECISLLVCTGIYQPTHDHSSCPHHGHRDVDHDDALSRPNKVVDDVLHGIKYIFEAEGLPI